MCHFIFPVFVTFILDIYNPEQTTYWICEYSGKCTFLLFDFYVRLDYMTLVQLIWQLKLTLSTISCKYHKIKLTQGQWTTVSLKPLSSCKHRQKESLSKHGSDLQMRYFQLCSYKLESIYLYFPPSSQLVYLCFCPVGLSLL